MDWKVPTIGIFRITINVIVIFILRLIAEALNWSPEILAMALLISAIVLDPLDSIPGRIMYGKLWAKTDQYEMLDKTDDILIFTAILIQYLVYNQKYMEKGGLVDPIFIYLMIATYIWRLIGTILYISTGNIMWIIYFANFYVQANIVYVLLTLFLHLKGPLLLILMVITFAAQQIFEVWMHTIWSKSTKW